MIITRRSRKRPESGSCLHRKFLLGSAGTPLPKFDCDDCGQSFAWESSLAQHKKTHIGTCFVMISKKSEFSLLQPTADSIAAFCGKVLSTKKSLESHKNSHLGKSGNRVKKRKYV